MNPYREASPPSKTVSCPSCGRPLDAGIDDEIPLPCPARCGAWYPSRLLPVPIATVGELDPIKPFASSLPLICPLCGVRLERRIASGIPFAICAAHGAWVALDSMVRFESRVDRVARELAEEARLVQELAESFTTSEGRIAIAKRLLALEARLAKLEKKP